MANWANAITWRAPDLTEAGQPLGREILGLDLGMGALGKAGLEFQAPCQDNLPLVRAVISTAYRGKIANRATRWGCAKSASGTEHEYHYVRVTDERGERAWSGPAWIA